jgi:hypothetical protein
MFTFRGMFTKELHLAQPEKSPEGVAGDLMYLCFHLYHVQQRKAIIQFLKMLNNKQCRGDES